MASIRDATEEDLPRIVELLAQLSLEGPRENLGPPLPETYRKAFREVLADAKQRQLVLEDGGRLNWKGLPLAEATQHPSQEPKLSFISCLWLKVDVVEGDQSFQARPRQYFNRCPVDKVHIEVETRNA